MRVRSYNKEIERATAQFLDIFNDITIDRRTWSDSVQKTIGVDLLYGSRRRILKSLENRANTVKLPLIVASIQSISRDATRAINVNDGLLLQNGTGTYDYTKNTPTPVDITYNVDIITKFQEDMDQIISNFVPFFNPDVFVVLPNPQSVTNKLKTQVCWNGSFNLDYGDEVGTNSPQRCVATTAFTMKTWIFPGMSGDAVDDKYIKRINFNPCIQYEDGIGRLSNWYAVPQNMTFSAFKDNIICGYIHPDFYDELQISANISGYWSDFSGLVTGLTLGEITSGDLTGATFLVTDEGGLLVITERCYLPKHLWYLTSGDYIDYYTSTITGELSGYGTCPYVSS